MALLKYQFVCGNEQECGKSYLVLVEPDESIVPDNCPFCGEKSSEVEE